MIVIQLFKFFLVLFVIEVYKVQRVSNESTNTDENHENKEAQEPWATWCNKNFISVVDIDVHDFPHKELWVAFFRWSYLFLALHGIRNSCRNYATSTSPSSHIEQILQVDFIDLVTILILVLGVCITLLFWILSGIILNFYENLRGNDASNATTVDRQDVVGFLGLREGWGT